MSDKEVKKDFEPKIVGFFCNWCTAAAADLAGTSRIQYPANIRPIRVMCSGAVDSSYVIKALLEGADGVLIGGCHPADCHYVNGNYKARRRVALLKSIMSTLELEPERVWLRWISASEGVRFAKVVRQMTDTIREPNPMGQGAQT